MANPWLKKNPFMSMWLSGVNAAAGKVRGHAAAEAKRQTTAATDDAVKQMVRFWTGGGVAPAKRKRR